MTICYFIFTDSCDREVNDIIVVSNITYLTSPNHPNYYEPSTQCMWLFTASDNMATFVITYLHLLLYGSDYLSIGSTHDMLANNTVTKKDWVNPPTTVIVQHHRIWIQFESNDDSIVISGFFVQIEAVKQNGTILYARYFSLKEGGIRVIALIHFSIVT